MQSTVHGAEAVLCFVLLQLAVIVLAARAGGAIAVRLGQARVVGEIVTGLLLGPSLLGALAPEVMDFVFRAAPLGAAASGVTSAMGVLSQIGLLLLMFEIGLVFEFRLLAERRERRAVAWVTAMSLVLPFGLGLAAGWLTHPVLAPGTPPLGYALFMATAMSITAVPVLGRIMLQLGIEKTPAGVVTMGAAALNDVVGWFVLAGVTALTLSAFSAGGMALQLSAFAAWAALCGFGLRPLLKGMADRHAQAGDALPAPFAALLLALIAVSAIVTSLTGIFALFGGFLIGFLLHGQMALAAAWRQRMGLLVEVLLLPVFFTYTGLRTELGALDAAQWGWCALLIAVATAGKLGGGWLGARLGGMGRGEARAVGAMMNARGLMELIVLNIGRDLGVIPQEVFTMLVVMAVFTTAITMPLVRRWLPQPVPPDTRAMGARA